MRLVSRCLRSTAALLAVAFAAPAAASSDADLRRSLAASMRSAPTASGALVVDARDGRTLFAVRPDVPRVPASTEKLFVTATALLRYRPEGTLSTRVLATGEVDEAGTFNGTLYLRGAGDPTFGSLTFTRRAYGGGATTYELARRLRDAGIRRVEGRVVGDESAFDRRRGSYGAAIDFDIGGPLSALGYDRGLSSASGTGVQVRPATFAASQLITALRGRGVAVTARPGEGVTPAGARELARIESLPMSTIASLTNRPSDNYVAEMLIKALGASFAGRGTTLAGAGVVRSTLAGLGVSATVIDGSGLSRRNRTSPRALVKLLTAMDRSSMAGQAFHDSLAVAGRSGTLAHRMRATSAAGRCRAKTGTLIGVSALSGYCDTAGGRRVAFAFLMNRANLAPSRAIQDTMTAAIARL